uniref:AlNc14C347G10869 protein n=1 Tax=Albugo laibachii Nc14 TaxID=890382 RepID=F0WXB7_9STRA|nr:AlNc14C347G10869 [Albugo laibachii Nc14]|eukprot:CCA26109.1 AlNc14C347G10869 [Albugo laibachii Nc14]
MWATHEIPCYLRDGASYDDEDKTMNKKGNWVHAGNKIFDLSNCLRLSYYCKGSKHNVLLDSISAMAYWSLMARNEYSLCIKQSGSYCIEPRKLTIAYMLIAMSALRNNGSLNIGLLSECVNYYFGKAR